MLGTGDDEHPVQASLCLPNAIRFRILVSPNLCLDQCWDFHGIHPAPLLHGDTVAYCRWTRYQGSL